MARFVRYAYLGSIAAAAILLVSNVALADDWQAIKLRGDVFVYSAPTSTWVRLRRGDIVSDSSVVRTLQSGAVEFVRDRETIDLGPDTQIQIFDRTGRRYTTVREFFGTVSVEANVENVQHFSVQTPFVAAVVKGTIFSVISNAKISTVTVQRGKVGVEDVARHLLADIVPGQQATAGVHVGLSVGKAAAASATAASATASSTTTTSATTSSSPTSSSPTSAAASDESSNGNGDGDGNGNGKGHGDGDGDGNGNGNGNGHGHGHGHGNGHR